jgi:CheY-like chemotaxis protein
MEKRPFDLRDCVEASLDLLAIRAAEKSLDLAYLIDPLAPGALVGDVTRLKQILVNLVSNAIKFTESGEVVISIEKRAEENGRHELLFAVRDTGIGIPPERMDRLFRSFSQVDASTTRRYGGTGLGLVISKRLTELMGGTMWVESEVGNGSTFYFSLTAEAAPSPLRVYLNVSQPQLQDKRVLIVDDNATNRQILRQQTESWGMTAHSCAGGIEALELVRRGVHFDLAILDIQMPEMDGFTLAREIRHLVTQKTLPLVALSSVGQRPSNGQDGLFNAFVNKPIKSLQLHTILTEVMTGHAAPLHETRVEPEFDGSMGERLPLRILVAEDFAVNQKLMLNMLAKLGYQADVANNGLEALAALEQQPYDLVLMDAQMPEMDGLEATRCIRERWPDASRPALWRSPPTPCTKIAKRACKPVWTIMYPNRCVPKNCRRPWYAAASGGRRARRETVPHKTPLHRTHKVLLMARRHRR